jgi:ABC-2 type transport system ATP-binding protein
VSPALTTAGLTKRYGDLAAVDDLTLSVDPGQVFGFLGPNGAGKTTTIRMLLGLVRPTAGTVEVLGEAVGNGHGVGALRRVGALVEEPAFYGYLSGRVNLDLFASAAGRAPQRRLRRARIDEVLAAVELTGAAGKKVRAYSQGMRQRLGIARALLGDPEVLILDEPTNGLDPQGIAQMRVLLRRLAGEGRTVLVSSHLLAEVEAACDRVAVIARGRLVAEGAPTNLRPSGTRLRLQVDDVSATRRLLHALDGVRVEGGAATDDGGGDRAVLHVRLDAPATSADVNARLVAAGVAVSALHPLQERLEDVFLDLTGDADAPR